MALAAEQQSDFSAGMWRSHRCPPNGCYDLKDFLIDDGGNPYQRGGLVGLTTPAFGGATGLFSSSDLMGVWDHRYEVGRRTLIASKTEWGVMSGDEHSYVTLPSFTGALTKPVRGTFLGGVLFLDNGGTYAGSRHPSTHSVGTVDVTQGSKDVVGVSTTFLSDADAGMLFGVGTGDAATHVIAAVTDDTHLTLLDTYKETTASGAGYAITPLGQTPKVATIFGSAGGRLLALIGPKLLFSRPQMAPAAVTDELAADGSGGATVATSFAGLTPSPDTDPSHFLADDFHVIPNGPDGLGVESWGDTAIVFTTDGVWTVSNMDLDPVDDAGNVQQSLSHTAPQIHLWHRNGLAKWQDTHVVPARDGIYLMGANSLEKIDAPINSLYQGYVKAGYTLGIATVFSSHYLLPVLEPGTFDQVDTLVCRLDRPVRTQFGTVRPWSRFAGPPIRAFEILDGPAATRDRPTADADEPGTSGRLVAASTPDKLLRVDYFSGTVGADYDTDYLGEIVTRDLPTGNGNKNLVRKITADYDLQGDGATLIAEYATEHPAETASYTTLAEEGGEGTDQFKEWQLPTPPRSRFLRIRLKPSAAASLVIRSIGLRTRQSTKDD